LRIYALCSFDLFVAIVWLSSVLAGQDYRAPPDVLPLPAVQQLSASLEAAAARARHVWRDTAPCNKDGTLNAYIEIARGDRRKWEFDMRAHARAIDRIIPDTRSRGRASPSGNVRWRSRK
jgi:hypothetical protein